MRSTRTRGTKEVLSPAFSGTKPRSELCSATGAIPLEGSCLPRIIAIMTASGMKRFIWGSSQPGHIDKNNSWFIMILRGVRDAILQGQIVLMKETKGTFPTMSGGIKRHAKFIKTVPPSTKHPAACGIFGSVNFYGKI